MEKLMNRLKHILLIIAILIIYTCSNVIIDGYKIYEKNVSGVSLKETVENIKNNKDYVTIDKIDEDFLQAIVSIEDHRFYEHGAIDVKSIIRASIANIKEGKIVQGGSTITQQLAKNIYFDGERKFSRKVAELIVANKLENNYSKDEILELYVNIINYGNGYIGIKEASEGYFNEDVDNLDLNEAAMLAGLPQCPNGYNPNNHYEKAIKRQKQVLAAVEKYMNIEHKDEYYMAKR